jgi:hypothetical protein
VKLLPIDYKLKELVEYVRQELSGMMWEAEGTDNTAQICNSVSDALSMYSRRVPLNKFRIIRCTPNKQAYEIDDHGYGVAGVDFLYQSLTVSPFMSSLIGVSPVMNMEGGDFDMFQRWRKSFMRVTSVTPKWKWDEYSSRLFIYNPVHHAVVGVTTHHPREFERVALIHKDWLRRYTLAKTKYKVGEARSKWGDRIPSPGGEINLNGTKLKDEASKEIEDLEKELFNFQPVPIPRWS